MKPILVEGLFWAKDSKVFLRRKVSQVVRYQIFNNLDPLNIVHTKKRTYDFNNDEILEVTVNSEDDINKLHRHFFYYDKQRSSFVEMKFEEIGEYEEGEDVLLKHLGLTSLKYKYPKFDFKKYAELFKI